MAAHGQSPSDPAPTSDLAAGAPNDDPVAFAAWHDTQLATLCDRICAGVPTAQTVIDGLKAKREQSKSPRVQAARSTIRRAKRCRCPQVTPPDQAGRSPRLP